MRVSIWRMFSAAAIGLLPSFSAWAQMMCAPRADIVSRLANTFNEHPRVEALNPAGNLVEFFVSDAGTFTVTLTLPDGRTCLVASGTDWSAVPAPLAGDPA